LNRILTDKEKTQFDALFPRTKTYEFASIENAEQQRMLKWIGIRWAVKESIYKV
jgi:phosphopantetheinyl transferase (holo-ACP synthase)